MGISRCGKRRCQACGALLPGHRWDPAALANRVGVGHVLCATAALPIFKCPQVDFWFKERECLTNRHESKAPPPSQFPGRYRRGIGTRPRRTSAQGSRSRCVLGRQRPNSVSLGRAKADSPSPRDGPQHPIPEIGSGALPRNIQAGGGNWQDRVNTMAPYTHAKMARSYGWSIETGAESVSGNQRITEDWQEAQRKLRERLQARDDKILDVVRKGEQLQFSDWVDFFLENYSKPPIRAEKTHEANERVGLAPQGGVRRSGRLARSLRMISSSIFEGGFRREFRSGPAAGSFKKTGSSRQQSIRSCGFFAVC